MLIVVLLSLLLCATSALADNVIFGVITDSTGRGAAGVEIDVTRCHCGGGKYPYPKPYRTITTMHHGGYDVCLPDDMYILTPYSEGRTFDPEYEIVTVEPCEAE